MTNTPILTLLSKLKDLDGYTRFILLTLIHAQEDRTFDSPISFSIEALHQTTGVSRGKISRVITDLLHRGYLIQLQGKIMLNGFKLQAIKQDSHVPPRIPYRKTA